MAEPIPKPARNISDSGDDATLATKPSVIEHPPTKPIHTIVLDSSPLLLNMPTLSTLLSQSCTLITTESVISEIRDEDARSRVQTLYRPFLTLRAPRRESIILVKEFARKTGDAAALSGPDFQVLALAYELECERNGGDWRLRRVPGQPRVNGSKPARQDSDLQREDNVENPERDQMAEVTGGMQAIKISTGQANISPVQAAQDDQGLENSREDFPAPSLAELEQSSGSDSEGWITPSNIKKHQEKDSTSPPNSKPSEQKVLQVATITGDFAMQNVLLHMNLNLLSAKTCKRITQLKHTILRCHGCFSTTREMDRQFCPRCGQPTLTRVSCTTNERGEVQLHLKAKMQWNNKGNVFSVPKPASGKSNQKWTGPQDGGGKGGWGRSLVLAEDQKEYVRATASRGRRRGKEKDLMDEDYLPKILTGERSSNAGRVRIGVDRNINARKR